MIKRMKLPTTKRELFEFFESIPEDQWCQGTIANGETSHCAVGHIAKRLLGINVYEAQQNYESDERVYASVQEFLTPIGLTTKQLYLVNDGVAPGSEKAAVLAFLQQAAQQA